MNAKKIKTKYGSRNAFQSSGRLVKNKPFLYNFELHARFKNTDDLFQGSILRGGFGYSFNTSSLLFGFDYLPLTKVKNKELHEYRIWQKFQWKTLLRNFKLSLQTRLEERINSSHSNVSIRLKQKVELQGRNHLIENLVPVFSNELAFTLNHVQWVSNQFVSENLAFLGVNILFKGFTLQAGYMNQIQFKPKEIAISHILQLAGKF